MKKYGTLSISFLFFLHSNLARSQTLYGIAKEDMYIPAPVSSLDGIIFINGQMKVGGF